jgi:hypothetical protein
MGTKTFLILGGYGLAGLNLASYLLQETSVRLILAGRNLDRASQAAAQLNNRFPGKRVLARRADAADAESLAQAFAGVDMVVVASSTVAYTTVVVQAALAASIDYLDIQYGPARIPVLQSFAASIAKAGLCFITEAGFHPGLPSALVRYLASQFDRMDSALVGSIVNQESGFPYTSAVDELMGEFRSYSADIFVDGHWRKADLSGTKDYLSMDFGPPFGRKSCVPLPLEEMRGVPVMFPSLQRTGFYIAGFNWVSDWIITPLIMLVLRIWPERGMGPMGKLLCWSTKVFGRPPYGVIVKAEASGEKDGQHLTKSVVVSHPDGYKLTAMPVVAYLLQYLDGPARRPGLHMMGHVLDPERLLTDMQHMGAAVTYQ